MHRFFSRLSAATPVRKSANFEFREATLNVTNQKIRRQLLSPDDMDFDGFRLFGRRATAKIFTLVKMLKVINYFDFGPRSSLLRERELVPPVGIAFRVIKGNKQFWAISGKLKRKIAQICKFIYMQVRMGLQRDGTEDDSNFCYWHGGKSNRELSGSPLHSINNVDLSVWGTNFFC